MQHLSVDNKSGVEEKTPLTARLHLANLEREMAMLIEMRGELNKLVEFCRTDYGRELINFKIGEVSLRIVRAQAEVLAISDTYFAELQAAVRDEKYPPIRAANKTVIRYADE